MLDQSMNEMAKRKVVCNLQPVRYKKKKKLFSSFSLMHDIVNFLLGFYLH